MKNLYLIAIVLICYSCSNSDDSVPVRDSEFENSYVYVSPAKLEKGNQVVIEFKESVLSFKVHIDAGKGYFIDCNGDISNDSSYQINNCNKVINYYPTDSHFGNAIRFIINDKEEFSMHYNTPRED